MGRVAVIEGNVGWIMAVAISVGVAGRGEGVVSASSVPRAWAVRAAAVSTAFGSGRVGVGAAGPKLHEDNKIARARKTAQRFRTFVRI
jgi:hypothetical protein